MSNNGESASTSTEPLPQPTTAKKKRIRAGYRSHATKLMSESRELLDVGPFSKSRADELRCLLKEKVRILHNINEEIFEQLPEEEIEQEVIDSEELQSKIHLAILELEARQKSALESGLRAPALPSVATSASSPQMVETPNLPKLNLPKYSGDPKKWQEWWDAYEVIHNNIALPNVYKFRHLCTLLEGPASAAIAGIQTTSANYDEAIAILQERFANKQLIINSHMEALLNLMHVSSGRDLRPCSDGNGTERNGTQSFQKVER